jgi:hypothetical protein
VPLSLGTLSAASITQPDTLGQRWRKHRTRRDANVWMVYAIKCIVHYHHHTMSQQMTPKSSRLANSS